MLPLFVVTLFTNAALLFLVQPLVSRMILPLQGGAPAVWTTCMLFFQTVLLGGYLYSHVLSTRLKFRTQLVVHGLVLLVPLSVLPIAVRSFLPVGAPPVLWILGALTASVALPFFALTAGAPLLQRWFSATGHVRAKDPYFLYAASNLGNLVGLVGYPLAMEPFLRVGQQSHAWMAGYLALAALTAVCAWAAYHAPGAKGRVADVSPPAKPLAWSLRLYWTALAFVPSSQMLGVTTYLTTDIAAIPLLWLIPLALYLLTFVVAFGRFPDRARNIVNIVTLPASLALFFLLVLPPPFPAWVLYVCHLGAFFLMALSCHGTLARSRPRAEYLTEFYLWLSVGGVLGGLFNAVLAPLVFSSILEYPLTLLLGCLLVPHTAKLVELRRLGRLDFGIAAAVAVVALALVRGHEALKAWGLGWAPTWLAIAGVPLLLCFIFDARVARFRLAVAAFCLITVVGGFTTLSPVYQDRSFFGVLSVIDHDEVDLRELKHGTTVHGKQSYAPHRRSEPLTYYHPDSPIGDVFRTLAAAKEKPPVAVVGLGTGTLAAYGRPRQRMAFYEIDPLVVSIAREPRYFTYLSDAEKRGVDLGVVVGDARLKLRDAAAKAYGLIVIDAFSSDAIPVHLLTAEAIDLYLSKLADGGMLAIHISNAYLRLEPVVADLAREARLLMLHAVDDQDEADEEASGRFGSEWVVMSRAYEPLRRLAALGGWETSKAAPGKAWRDDFSNLVGTLNWTAQDDEDDDGDDADDVPVRRITSGGWPRAAR